MQLFKKYLLSLVVISLFILAQQTTLFAAIEEQFTTESANQEFLPSLPSYQPNNVMEITGVPDITYEDFKDLNTKTAQELIYFLYEFKEPSTLFFDSALMSKTASILVPRKVLCLWINVREAILHATPEALIKAQKKEGLKKLDRYEHRPIDQEYAACINQEKTNRGFFNSNLLNEWLIYRIKNTDMFLLIPSFANLAHVEKFFCISNKSICMPMNSIDKILESATIFYDKVKKNNQLKNQAKKQPKNKHLVRAAAKKERSIYKYSHPDFTHHALQRIFQPNSSHWIFLRTGHGDIMSSEKESVFCGTSFETNFARAKFLGSTIKTFINFDMTCFGGAEHAKQIGDELYALSKNNKEFTPYIYGIYALTAHIQYLQLNSYTHQKFTHFFSQLRDFEKTKKLTTFKTGVENLFSFNPILKSYEPEEIGIPEISNYGITSHPLIFIPNMKAFIALPTTDFSVFNDPHAKPNTKNKKAILLYTQKIDEICLYPTTITQQEGKELTNCLPSIISMCAAQPSSKKNSKLTVRFHEIKKLITPTTLDQVVIEAFTRNNDEIQNIFVIRELHCINEHKNPKILFNVVILKHIRPQDDNHDEQCYSLVYVSDSTIKQPFYRWQTPTKEYFYYVKHFWNTKAMTELGRKQFKIEEKQDISKEEYNAKLALALSFKQQKNPHTYQKPLKALGKWMEEREKQDKKEEQKEPEEEFL